MKTILFCAILLFACSIAQAAPIQAYQFKLDDMLITVKWEKMLWCDVVECKLTVNKLAFKLAESDPIKIGKYEFNKLPNNMLDVVYENDYVEIGLNMETYKVPKGAPTISGKPIVVIEYDKTFEFYYYSKNYQIYEQLDKKPKGKFPTLFKQIVKTFKELPK